MQAKVKFHQSDKTFHALLKVRVNQYFEDNGISRYADGRMVMKTLFWVAAFAMVYGLYLSGTLPALAVLALLALNGFIVACLGFNTGHDAIHGAYSSKPRVNWWLGCFFDVLGASSYTWSVAHNWLHHTYTNVPLVDSDLDPGPWLRFDPARRVYWFHRFQHLYMWPLYTLTTLVWTFKKDWVQIAERDPRTGKRARPAAVLGMVAGKLVHFAIFLAIPALVTPYSLGLIVGAYVVSQLVAGFTLAVVFQLAHVVEGPVFPRPDETSSLRTSWAEHQVRTTANFSSGGPLATFLLGGLNHQVEHHLFSGICHIHYPALADIVRKTARELGLPYHEHDTFFSALRSHYRVMRALGRGQTVLAGIEGEARFEPRVEARAA
jgi:linoleoyl-CoA desaturase